MKILFTGGGTAGHIFPIIALYRELKKQPQLKELRFFYLGPKDEFIANLLLQEGIEVKTILAGKIRRYFNPKAALQNLFDILVKIPVGFFQSLFHIFVISPDAIFSKGGYGSLSPVLAGWFLLTPIFMHESDIVPGLANRLTGRVANEIFVSFRPDETGYFPPKKMFSSGNPIRKEILEGQEAKAKELFKLSGEKPVILIMGGSQGSQRINDIILSVLPDFLANFELIHQVGTKNIQEVEAETQTILSPDLKKHYHPFSFLNEEELKHAYQASRLIVARAGSTTIFEIAALGKPSILIPLPEAAQNHQVKNAYNYQKNGACLVIEEANLTPHFFLERIKNLFSQPEKMTEMATKAKSFSKPRATQIIAEYLKEYLIK